MPKGQDPETPATDLSNDVVDFTSLAAAAPVIPGAPGPIAKEALIGVRFIIYAVEFKIGDEEKGGREYVIAKLVLENNEKAFFSDGSTGIYAQLKSLSEKGVNPPYAAAEGLRVSTYANQYGNDNKTYYIA
jgi:hypothetical protein